MGAQRMFVRLSSRSPKVELMWFYCLSLLCVLISSFHFFFLLLTSLNRSVQSLACVVTTKRFVTMVLSRHKVFVEIVVSACELRE
jgi:hypothetical protein